MVRDSNIVSGCRAVDWSLRAVPIFRLISRFFSIQYWLNAAFVEILLINMELFRSESRTDKRRAELRSSRSSREARFSP